MYLQHSRREKICLIILGLDLSNFSHQIKYSRLGIKHKFKKLAHKCLLVQKYKITDRNISASRVKLFAPNLTPFFRMIFHILPYPRRVEFSSEEVIVLPLAPLQVSLYLN